MARLSEMYRLIGNYLELKGDKEVTSIGSVHGGIAEYALHLHDIHDGPPGTNPYSGADTLEIPKERHDTALPGTIGGRMVQMMLDRQAEERAARKGGSHA